MADGCSHCEWIRGALLHPRYANDRMEGHISSYRGYQLHQEGPYDRPTYVVIKNNQVVTRCNSAWGCHVYIDELLSP